MVTDRLLFKYYIVNVLYYLRDTIHFLLLHNLMLYCKLLNNEEHLE